MANIKQTTADTSGFIPQYWAQRALDVLRSQIVLAQVVARDVNFGEPGWKGKSITVPYPGTFTAVDKSADTPVTPQVPANGSSVTLTLNKHKVVPFLVEDFASAQANTDLMDRYIQPAVIALAEQFETDLWTSAMSLGTVTPLGAAGTDISASTVRSAMKGLNDAKAPTTDRYLVVSTKDQIALLGDSSLQTYFAYNQTQGIRNGYVGPLYGMETYYSQLIPSGWSVSVNATGGTFTLSIGGQTTGNLAQNASPATVQTALSGLSSVGSGNVVVSGVAKALSVVFVNGVTGTLTADSTSLTGGTHTATVAASQKNLALHRNGVMFAVRPFAPTPANAGVFTAQAMDSDSGLSLRVAAQYDINNVGVRCNIDILYGTVSLRPNQGIIIDA